MIHMYEAKNIIEKFAAILYNQGLGLSRLSEAEETDVYVVCLSEGQNMITKVEGISKMVHLQNLDLNNNSLEDLTGFSDSMKGLHTIDLKENDIADISEISKLKCLSSLKTLWLTDNPVCKDEEFRVEILVTLLNLEMLNEDEYTEEERAEAKEIYRQRIEAQNEQQMLERENTEDSG